ncbi:hypothetical protein DI09_55p110 [Mitosporidium daphniae]|uniref:Uncharacterized protein n=1 Tax=Mitosporidium daphniae TaxID=1485682 RepID=A0A098VPR4_9MICR|nr:uncharacterized protein DI09_55p110 [Mitosporidium daphniae]KGG50794.1 hypothetical protein DI09_55p110 [Mitosporidium daphniae]|eukprot:XP_013237221.1 uncharacterized protein DI09_55p110 [Mitosporidium daphniae]
MKPDDKKETDAKFGSMAKLLARAEDAEKQEAISRQRGETLFVGGGQAVHGRNSTDLHGNPLSMVSSLIQRIFSSDHRVASPVPSTSPQPRLVLWRDGWQLLVSSALDDELRSYEDPLLERIMEGKAPSSILGISHGGEIDIHIDTSRINDAYEPGSPPGSFISLPDHPESSACIQASGVKLGSLRPPTDLPIDLTTAPASAEPTVTPIGRGDGSLVVIDVLGTRHAIPYDVTSATIGDLLAYVRQEFAISDLAHRGVSGLLSLSAMEHSKTIDAAGLSRTILVAL